MAAVATMRLIVAMLYAAGAVTDATPTAQPCPSECRCHEASRTVYCTEVSEAFTTYVKELPQWTNDLVVVCRPRTNVLAWRALRPDAFRNLLDVREISLRHCPIVDIPDELFAYLPQLQELLLDNMPFSTLPGGLFRGSGRLRELTIIRTPYYTRQATRPLAGTSVERIRLVATGLSGGDFLNLIAPVAGRLRQLDVKSGSGRELRLPPGAFNATSSLAELVLTNNGIVDFRFLDGVSAERVSLSYNPVGPSGLLSFVGMRPNWRPKALILSHMGLRQIPDGLAAFPALEELTLSNNEITDLPAVLIEPLEKLSKLDLSANKIRTLSSDLRPILSSLLYRDRYSSLVYLADNPIHCNCDLTWIFDSPVLHNNLPKDVTCASGGRFTGELLARVQRHQLRCIPPSQPIIEMYIGGPQSATPGEHTLAPIGDQVRDGQEYQLPAGGIAEVTCISTGDPAPVLRWLWREDILKAPPPESAEKPEDQSRLTLRVDQARMSARRVRLTCLAAGHQGVVVKTAIVLVKAPPPG